MTLVGVALQKLEGNKVIISSQPAWETHQLALLPLFPLAMLPAVCRPTCSDQRNHFAEYVLFFILGHSNLCRQAISSRLRGIQERSCINRGRVISPLLSCSPRGGLKLLSLPPLHQSPFTPASQADSHLQCDHLVIHGGKCIPMAAFN